MASMVRNLSVKQPRSKTVTVIIGEAHCRSDNLCTEGHDRVK